MRRSRFLAIALAVAVLVVPVAAAAESGPSGWARTLADDQGTMRGSGDGPAAPAVRWVHRAAGTFTDGRHGGPAFGKKDLLAIDDRGQVLVRVVRDGSSSDTQSLIAVKGDTGTESWRRDGIVPECPPTVGPDGTVWVVIRPTTSDPFVLHGLDPATGATKPGRTFQRETDSDINPMFQPCDFTGSIRFLSDGTLLIRERSFATASAGEWLRAIDGATMAQRWARKLTPTFGADVPNRWSPDFRVGAAGTPNADTIYLIERGADSGSGPFTQRLHSLDPLTGALIDHVVIPGTDMAAYDAEFLIAGTTIYGSTADDDGGSARNGWVWAVGDDGDGNLSELWKRPTTNTAAHASETARYHLTNLTIGDGSTLVANTFNSTGTVVGVRASDGDKVWDLPQFGCLTGQVVVDRSGHGYFTDFCKDVLASVSPSGWVRWTLPLSGAVPKDGGGTVDLSPYSGLRVQAVAANGDVILTGHHDASGDVVVMAVTLGEMIERQAGAGRLETAIEISQAVFPAGAPTVVLARADQYPDALAGAPLAVAEEGPLLLSERATLSAVTAAEIQRLGATHAILLGGEAALSSSVQTTLEGRGLTVERISGANRFDTARRIKDRIGTDTAVLVEGANPDPTRGWPDAVAASGWAASTGRAILLVTKTSLPAETAAALEGVSDAVVVGGTAAVSADVAAAADRVAGSLERIFGASRYETSTKVAERSLADGNNLDVVWLATGTAFPDALTAGPASALTGGVLLLLNGRDPAGSPESIEFLADHAADVGAVHLIGGSGAISEATADAVADALGR